ncbi:MAG: hypothetical protein KIG94_06535 [Acetatifactor sp.]|nr:hypothetical protein [Acetatifactor sp.]
MTGWKGYIIRWKNRHWKKQCLKSIIMLTDAFTVMVSYAVYLKRGVLREAG